LNIHCKEKPMSHAIITGHTRGVGAALAEQLLQRGFAVLGMARGRNLALEQRFPEQLAEIRLDLSDPVALLGWLGASALREFLAPASAVYLINNAGLLQPVGPLGTQEGPALMRSVATNVTAPLLLSNAVVAATKPDVRCRILHISSGVGRRPCAGWSVYSATKAALDQHARSAGLDGLPNVAIASIAPGVIDTDMQTEIRASDPEKFPPLAQFHALKRDGLLSTPAACAEKLLRYLLADEFVSGAVVDVREMPDA
jgi:benzil reductase ((S)-benzoin forming)